MSWSVRIIYGCMTNGSYVIGANGNSPQYYTKRLLIGQIEAGWYKNIRLVGVGNE